MPVVFAFLGPVLSQILLSFAISVIGGVLQMVFAKKPKRSPLSFEDRTITVRQPAQPWQIVFGAARVGGTIIFLERKSPDMWLGVEWCHLESKAIDSVYADEEQIFVNPDGTVEGARNGQLEVYNHLGDAADTAEAAVMTAFPLKWTANHIGIGIAKSFFRFVNLATNWENTVPNVSADIRGALAEDPRTGLTGYTDNLAVLTRHFLREPDYGEGASAEEIDDANFRAEANICDEEVALPEWTENWELLDDHTTTFTVNTSTNVLTVVAPWNVYTGDKCFVVSSGTLPAPLAAGTGYFYRRITATTGTLHPTQADAEANTNIIDITTTGSGTHRITFADALLRMLGRETTFTANTGTDEITLAKQLRVPIGIKLVFSFQSTVTLPAPLVAGTKYTNVADISDRISTLETYPVSAGTINITTAGTGVHSARILALAVAFTDANVDTPSDSISVGTLSNLGAGYLGQPVRFRVKSGSAPSPLVDGATYYIIPDAPGVLPGRVQLALSLSDAESGRHIDILTTGSGSFFLEALELGQNEMLGVPTGTVVVVDDATGGGNMPTPLIENTEYYLIRRGRGVFQLAATLADALAGSNIELQDRGTNADNAYLIKLKRERRYTANGVFTSDQDTLDIEKALAACCAGSILEPLGSGKWRIKTGIYRLPMPPGLMISDVRQGGVPELQTLLPGAQAANTVKGVYTSPLNFDHPSDFPAVSDPNDVAKDGEELVADQELPFTNSKTMARRIANIVRRRKRRQRIMSFPATLPAGFRYEYGDGVRVDLAPLPIAFDAEVVGWDFRASGDGDGPPKPSIDLTLREADPWIYR